MTTKPTSGFFASGEMFRLFGLLGLLGVIGMLVWQARDERVWRWLAADEGKAETSTAAPAKTPPPSPAPTVAAPEPAVPSGPTDEEPEQREAAAYEFQALSDRKLFMHKEEMPAYWRLFSWAEHQSFEALSARAEPVPRFNDFVQRPDDMRGRLFRIKLELRQINPGQATENALDVEKVYELWGRTEQQTWLYCGLTAHLPPGMPTGQRLRETVTLVGYFLKVQGYHPDKAKPQDEPVGAPLFIGRIEWHKAAAPVKQEESSFAGWWFWAIGLGIIALGLARLFLPSVFGASAPVMKVGEQAAEEKSQRLVAWLAGDPAEGEAQREPWEVPEKSWRTSAAEDDSPDD